MDVVLVLYYGSGGSFSVLWVVVVVLWLVVVLVGYCNCFGYLC